MDSSSLSYKTFKNISYSLFGYGWGFIFTIFVTPLIVLKMGVEMYGVYILVLTVNSIMGLFDLGVGYILVKYISEYHTAGEEKKMKDLMFSFNLILLVLSILSLVLLSLIGYFADSLFPSEIISGNYYFIVFFLSGAVSFVNGISSIFTVVPVALQRLDISTKIGLVNMTLSTLTFLFLVMSGYGLKTVFFMQLFYSIIFFFIYRYFSKKLLPQVELRFAWVWSEVKHAYKFGIATYVSNAANSALTYFDRLLIPIFLGPAALSYYSLPGSVAGKTPSVTNTLSGIIFPMISGLNGIDDQEKIRSIYKRAFNLLTVVSFSVTISIILFANKILYYWLSPEFAQKSTKVLIVLAFTYYLLSLGGTLNNFLMGLSKTKFLFQASLFMALANIGLLFILLPRFEIIGAAWAYLISVLPIVFMFYFTEKEYLKLTGRFRYYLKLYFKLAVSAVIFGAIIRFGILPLVVNLRSLVILGPASVVLYMLIYGLFGFYDQEDLQLIKNFIATIIGKIKFNNAQING